MVKMVKNDLRSSAFGGCSSAVWDELAQTQLGGVCPYNGFKGVMAGWFIDGVMLPSSRKRRVPSSISLIFLIFEVEKFFWGGGRGEEGGSCAHNNNTSSCVKRQGQIRHHESEWRTCVHIIIIIPVPAYKTRIKIRHSQIICPCSMKFKLFYCTIPTTILTYSSSQLIFM